VTLAIVSITSGIRIVGNKPFAAFAGSMIGSVQPTDGLNYVVVVIYNYYYI
jgi:hypothetical protein